MAKLFIKGPNEDMLIVSDRILGKDMEIEDTKKGTKMLYTIKLLLVMATVTNQVALSFCL